MAQKDVGHLYKLKNYTSSDHKVTESLSYPRCSFGFTSLQVTSKLEELYSITPNKSFNLQYPVHLPIKFDRAFIRGYFDGDGTICESFSNKASKITSLYLGFIGAPDFIETLKTKLFLAIAKDIDSLKTSIHANKKNKLFKLSTRDARNAAHFIYKGSTEETRLSRKYSLYKKLMVLDLRETR